MSHTVSSAFQRDGISCKGDKGEKVMKKRTAIAMESIGFLNIYRIKNYGTPYGPSGTRYGCAVVHPAGMHKDTALIYDARRSSA